MYLSLAPETSVMYLRHAVACSASDSPDSISIEYRIANLYMGIVYKGVDMTNLRIFTDKPLFADKPISGTHSQINLFEFGRITPNIISGHSKSVSQLADTRLIVPSRHKECLRTRERRVI